MLTMLLLTFSFCLISLLFGFGFWTFVHIRLGGRCLLVCVVWVVLHLFSYLLSCFDLCFGCCYWLFIGEFGLLFVLCLLNGDCGTWFYCGVWSAIGFACGDLVLVFVSFGLDRGVWGWYKT